MDMSKYEKVLRPLKQLEEVWGIDLAAALQSYAAEVAEVKVVMGGQALNFAQAALLIMGASSIYSKKVDALQTLVQDTYDLIINKKNADSKDENTKKKRKRVVLRQAVRFCEEGTAITPASNLYRDDVTETLRLILAGSDAPGARGICRDVARISEGELIPFEDTQSGGFNYRVNICTITADGLLLPNVKQELTRPTAYDSEHVTPKRHKVHMPTTPASTVTSKNILTESAQKRSQMEDEKGFGRAYAEELKKALAADEKKEEEEESDEEERSQKEEEENEEHNNEPDEYDELMKMCKQDRFEVTLKETPFDQLEIREKTSACDPVKQLVTEVLKEKMDSNINDKLRKVDVEGNVLWDTELLGKTAMAGGKSKDLEEYYAAAKDKLKKCLMKERNTEKKAAEDAQSVGTAPERDNEDVESCVARAPDGFPLPNVDMADVDMDVDMADVHMDMPDDPHEGDEFEASTPDPQRRLLDTEMAVHEPHDELLDFNTDITRMNDLLNAVHMECNEKMAHTSREEANLHVKISAWQNKLEPLLEEQNNRPVFDIHEYATRILDQFEEREAFSFSRLATIANAPWEVPRFFLAMLQLTNTQNIKLDIDHKQNGELSDEIKITLITKENVFHFDEVNTESGGVMFSDARSLKKRGTKRKL